LGTLGGSTPGESRLRESRVAQLMTSSRIAEHPTALFTTGLPILQVALNPSVMTKNFEASLTAANGWGRREVSHANLVAYKQGNRGLIRYDLSGGSEPDEVVLGKLYPDPGRAARVDDIMRWLWGDVFSNADPLTVPQPLGCVPELAMLVFKPLAGQPLDSALSQGADASTIELCARWLAALHGASTALDRRFDLAVEVVNLEAWAALIAHRYPGFEAASQDLFRALRQRSTSLALEWNAPIHKDFHYQHVFVNGGLGVIDFDEIRWGDRNCDIAHFCAHLSLLSIRARNEGQLSRLEDVFRSGYARWSDWSRDERFDFFFAFTCLKIAKQLVTTRGIRPRPEGAELKRQLEAVMQEGLDAIAGRR
jgi:Phosphotransferase enzyme family